MIYKNLMVIRMNNLYEHFGCQNKEDLYRKIKNNDTSVKSLVDFIDYSKGMEGNPHKSIVSPDRFAQFMKQVKMPEDDEAVSVFVSTKNQPIHLERFKINDTNSYKKALKNSLNAGAVSQFFVYTDHDDNLIGNKDKNVERYFKDFGIHTIDSFIYNTSDQTLISNKDRSKYPAHSYENLVSESTNMIEGDLNKQKPFNSFKGFDEFSAYFAFEEIKELNMLHDYKKVKDNLKIGLQNHWQELFGIITTDKHKNVLDSKTLFKGATDSALVDIKVIAKEILADDNIETVSLFHNHPSGQSSPSGADIKTTKNIQKTCQNLDIKLLDHFIAGKEKVYSFEEKMHSKLDFDSDYHENINKRSVKKKENKEVEMGM